MTALPDIMIPVQLSTIVYVYCLWDLDKNRLASVPLNRLGLSFEGVRNLSSVSQMIVQSVSSTLNKKLHFEDSWFEHANRVLRPESFERLILSWLVNGFDGSSPVFVLSADETSEEKQVKALKSNIAAFAH